jgi:hypothetical protein
VAYGPHPQQGDLLGGMLHERSSLPSVVRVNQHANPANKRTLMDDALGPSFAPPRGHGCGKGYVRKKAAQILVAAP